MNVTPPLARLTTRLGPRLSARRVVHPALPSHARSPLPTLARPYGAQVQLLPPRGFATSTARHASAFTTIKDPNHPSGVYYHQIPDTSTYAISFLAKPPSVPTSASIIAFITAPPSNKTPIYELAVQKPDLVEANRGFLELLHDTLKRECVQDGLLEYEAALRKDGWAHLNDQRHPLMPGRIATPENIIASVAFTDGTLRPESYEPNGVYRVVTGEEGFMELRPNWLMFVKERCEEVN